MNKLNERVSFPSSIIAILNDEIFQLCGDEFLEKNWKCEIVFINLYCIKNY